MLYNLVYQLLNFVKTSIEYNFNSTLESIRIQVPVIDQNMNQRSMDLVKKFFDYNIKNDPHRNPMFIVLMLVLVIVPIINLIIFFDNHNYRGIDDIVANTILINIPRRKRA
jgi:hypothetical protein